MNQTVRNFVVIDSIHGPFVINRHCALQAEALIKTGRPHIQAADTILHVIDQLPDDAIAVDGGANAGPCVPIAHRLRARGGVFEPQRTLFHALGGTVALNQLDNVHLLNMGRQRQRDDEGARRRLRTGGRLRPASLVDGQADGGTPTPVVRLDSLGLPRLDFLKLDIEGMEIDARAPADRDASAVVLDRILESRRGADHRHVRRPRLHVLPDRRPEHASVPNPRWDRQKLIISANRSPSRRRRNTIRRSRQRQPQPPTPRRPKRTGISHSTTSRAANGAMPSTAGTRARGRGRRRCDRAAARVVLRLRRRARRGARTLRRSCRPARRDAWAHRTRAFGAAAARRPARGRLATIASENVLTAAQFGLATERFGQPLQGKRLLVLSYGGVGDQPSTRATCLRSAHSAARA